MLKISYYKVLFKTNCKNVLFFDKNAAFLSKNKTFLQVVLNLKLYRDIFNMCKYNLFGQY